MSADRIANGLSIVRPELLAHWEDARLTPRLREILLWAGEWTREYGGVLWITSIHRTFEEEECIQLDILKRRGMASPEREQCAQRLASSSLHPRWRAIDTRIPLIAGASVFDLVQEACQKFPYDPQRPKLRTAIRHIGTGDHLHWQAMTARPGRQ